MTTSHGSVQGYNGQVVVDAKHQVIVHGEVFGTGQDADLVPPMIDGTKENMEKNGHKDADEYFEGKIFTADSAYHSKGNLQKCVDEKLDAYIPDKWQRMRDQRYEEWRKQGKTSRTHFAHEDFIYHEDSDEYVCPNGKILHFKTKHMVIKGTVYRTYRSKEQDCRGCALREKCLTRKTPSPKTKCLMFPNLFQNRFFNGLFGDHRFWGVFKADDLSKKSIIITKLTDGCKSSAGTIGSATCSEM